MQPETKEIAIAAAGLAAAVVIATLSIAALAPPAPRGQEAPPDHFSAARALDHVEAIATRPRPVGSAAHLETRAYLLDRLAELGLETEVHTGTEARLLAPDRLVAARLHNLFALLPGSAPTGTVLLVAHYDSRPQTPGAGDDAAGVAVILETLRALGTGPPPVNDLAVLLSDGEELGLLGARLFAREHPRAASLSVVLNLEGRGSRGPALMFETGPGNLGPVRELARTGARPMASSLTREVYKRMPNDTDFTVFRDRGVPGLNFAFIGDLHAYHTMLDVPERLDPRSVQHLGAQVLALSRRLARVDLGDPTSIDAVYFNPVPSLLAVYPASRAKPLALALLLLAAVAVGLARVRGRASPRSMAAGVGLWAGLVAAGGALGWLFGWLLGRWGGAWLAAPHGVPYEGGLLGLALVLLVGAAALALCGPVRRARPLELAAGVLIVWALLGAGLSWTIPGASYQTVWPALALAAGVGVAALCAGGGHDRSALVVLVLSGLLVVLVWAPLLALLFAALTVRGAAVLGLLLGMALTALAPPLAVLRAGVGSRSVLVPVALAAAALVAAGVRGGASAERPLTDELLYGLDAESGKAFWVGPDPSVDAWTARFLGEAPERAPAPDCLLLSEEALLAPAPGAALAPPVAILEADDRASGRHATLRVRSPRGAPVVRLEAEAPIPLDAVTIDGRRVPLGDEEDGPPGSVRIAYFGLPEAGAEIGFELAAPWPLELKLADMSWGLDGIEGFEPRPPDRIPDSGWATDTVIVCRRDLL